MALPARAQWLSENGQLTAVNRLINSLERVHNDRIISPEGIPYGGSAEIPVWRSGVYWLPIGIQSPKVQSRLVVLINYIATHEDPAEIPGFLKLYKTIHPKAAFGETYAGAMNNLAISLSQSALTEEAQLGLAKILRASAEPGIKYGDQIVGILANQRHIYSSVRKELKSVDSNSPSLSEGSLKKISEIAGDDGDPEQLSPDFAPEESSALDKIASQKRAGRLRDRIRENIRQIFREGAKESRDIAK